MITMLGSSRRCRDGLTRRESLKAGALSMLGGGFTLPHLFAAEERARTRDGRPGKAKSVILLYLPLNKRRIRGPQGICLLVDDDVFSLFCPRTGSWSWPHLRLVMIHSPSCKAALGAIADRSIRTPTSGAAASTP
jgi:hypothetical protein